MQANIYWDLIITYYICMYVPDSGPYTLWFIMIDDLAEALI